MKPINQAIWKFLLMLADIAVYIASAVILFLGLSFLIKERKFSEAMAIGGAALVIFCKVDQAIVKLKDLQDERSSQYVRKDF